MANWKWFGKAHTRVYKWSGGRLGKRLAGIDIVLVDTVGRKSGLVRSVPIACYPWKDSVCVVASNNGQAKDPIWWLNLQANPEVDVMLGTDHFRARAVELKGDEREAVWPEIVRNNPRQAEYARTCPRVLPVVYFERV